MIRGAPARHATAMRLPSIVLWWCGCLAALTGAEAAALPFRLRLGEVVPPAVAGEWARLADGARVALHAGEPLQDILPGAYRRDDRASSP